MKDEEINLRCNNCIIMLIKRVFCIVNVYGSFPEQYFTSVSSGFQAAHTLIEMQL